MGLKLKLQVILIFIQLAHLRVHGAMLFDTATEVSDGPCRPSKPVILSDNNNFIDKTTIGFVTYGSQSVFRTQAERFLGRPAVNTDEIYDLCWQSVHSFVGPQVMSTHIAYGDRVQITRGRINPSEGSIIHYNEVIARSTGLTETIKENNTILLALKDHLLMGRCTEDKVYQWWLYSLVPPTSAVMKTVREKVIELKFNEDNVLDLTDGHKFKCSLQPPSFSDMASKVLLALNVFDEKSPLFGDLQGLVFGVNGRPYETLVDYYKSFLGDPIQTLFSEVIRRCNPNQFVQKLPLACALFTNSESTLSKEMSKAENKEL